MHASLEDDLELPLARDARSIAATSNQQKQLLPFDQDMATGHSTPYDIGGIF